MEKRLTLFFVSLFLFVGSALAQTKVSGTVLSQEDGQPIIGAAVQVTGTSTGMLTDVNGRFSLTLPEGSKTLTISYLGYESKTVNAKNGMRVFLKADVAALDEVIVVAYGTQKKSAFTGSAAQVDAKAIEAHVSSNVANSLAGAAPGVQVINSSGDPTSSSPTIRIRGIGSMSAGNNPLIVLDGMPYDGALNSINPNDVESMTVLKDASASAIYGARGANGVVLITTKKGRNQDAEIRFDAKWGSNSRLIPQYDVITDPGQYYETHFAQLYNSQIYNGKTAEEAYAFANKNIYDQNNGGLGYQIFTVPEGENLVGTNLRLNPNAKLGYSDGEYYYTPDNWYDEAFHNSFRQEYNVSLSGVTDKLNYYASAGYLKDGGIVNNSDMQRYTARLNVDYQVKKWLKVGTNMAFSHRDANQPSYSSSWGSSGNIFYICNMIAPIYPLYVRSLDANGNPYIRTDKWGHKQYDYGVPATNFPGNGTRLFLATGNPIGANQYNTAENIVNQFTGAVTLDIDITKWLKFNSNNNLNVGTSNGSVYGNPFYGPSASDNANIDKTSSTTTRQNYVQTLNFHKLIGLHDVQVMVGHEWYKTTTKYLEALATKGFSPDIPEINAFSNRYDSHSYTTAYNVEGWFGNALYNYQLQRRCRVEHG